MSDTDNSGENHIAKPEIADGSANPINANLEMKVKPKFQLEDCDDNDCSHIPNHELFQTGDLLLFSGKSVFPSELIQMFTHSKYSHTGIILRDPVFAQESFKGLYILESTGYIAANDVEKHKRIVGVQINRLSDVYKDVGSGTIYWRRLITTRDKDFYQILSNVHTLTYGKGYDFDPADWIKAYFDIIDKYEQKEDVFICSALCSFLFDRLGLLVKPVNWTIVRPVDMGTEYPESERRIAFINCTMEPEIQIKFDKDIDHEVKENADSNASYFSRFTAYLKSFIWQE